MSPSPLRWGLLSTARINRALIPPLRKSPRNRLAAVASRSPQKAQEYACQWDIPRAHGSYEDLLADPEIDVIYNSLPNALHAEWTIRAAQAGKHVLCEKPLALTLDEVDAIAAAAQKAGVVVAEAFMYRHHPQTLQARELLASGAIGPLQRVRGAFTFFLERPGDVRWDPARGGGSLWDVGCYPVSYARTVLAAEPVEVFGWQTLAPSGVDAAFVGQLRFPGGQMAQFDCGFRSPFRAEIEIVGEGGRLIVQNPFKPGAGEQLRLIRNDGREQLIPVAGQDLYLGEVEDLADAVLLGKLPRVSLADSRANVAALLALYQSARSGQPVTL